MDASASFLEPRTLKVHWTARVSPVHAAVALTALALVVRVVGLTSRPFGSTKLTAGGSPRAVGITYGRSSLRTSRTLPSIIPS